MKYIVCQKCPAIVEVEKTTVVCIGRDDYAHRLRGNCNKCGKEVSILIHPSGNS